MIQAQLDKLTELFHRQQRLSDSQSRTGLGLSFTLLLEGALTGYIRDEGDLKGRAWWLVTSI